MMHVLRGRLPQRRHLEFTQDRIVSGLCLLLFAGMVIKPIDLARSLFSGTDFSMVIGDALFILVLLELFRLRLIYLDEHRVSVATMAEVGIVSILREVILRGALHIEWPQLLVVCVFMLTLGAVLRFSGIRLPALPRIRRALSDDGLRLRLAGNRDPVDGFRTNWP
jgi:uncharacterized membrane protein (DUF373 family)